MRSKIAYALIQNLYYPAALGASFAAVVLRLTNATLASRRDQAAIAAIVLTALALWYFTLSYLVTLFHQPTYGWADFASDMLEAVLLLLAFAALDWFEIQRIEYSPSFAKACLALAGVPLLHLIWNIRRKIRRQDVSRSVLIANVIRLIVLLTGVLAASRLEASVWAVCGGIAALNLWYTRHKVRLGELGPAA